MSSVDIQSVLLVRPRYDTLFSRFRPIVTEPLALEYLSAVCTQAGHRSVIYDRMIDSRRVQDVLRDTTPDIVAITGYIAALPEILQLAEQVKRHSPAALVVVGGVHAEVNPAEFQCDHVDVIVTSGGALVLADILQARHSQAPLSSVHGLTVRQADGSWLETAVAAFDPNRLPHPDREYFTQNRHHFRDLRYGALAIVKTAYGCPFDCCFCYCRVLNGERYSPRDLPDVVREIESIECERIWLTDDTFVIDVARVAEFARLLAERDIRKVFTIYARASSITENPDVVLSLKRMGVVDVIMGIESVEDHMLEAYSKSVSAAENEQAVRILTGAGIETTALFIVEPDARLLDFMAIYRWVRRLRVKAFAVSVFTPLPGTAEYQRYSEQLTTQDRRKWDLMHLVLPTTRLPRWLFMFMLHAIHAPMVARYLLAMLGRKLTWPQSIWDFWAVRYERLWVQRVSLGPTRQLLVEEIEEWARRTGSAACKLLDMGCGTAQLAEELSVGAGCCRVDYTGVDVSASMIAEARRKRRDISCFAGDVHDYRAATGSYDVIVCAHSFPYYRNKRQVMALFHRWLRPGGMLLMAQACKDTRYDRIMMPVVSITTSCAEYLPKERLLEMARGFFVRPHCRRVSQSRWVPSINLLRWERAVDEREPEEGEMVSRVEEGI